MIYRTSIFINAALGLIFILLGIIGVVNSKSGDNFSVILLLFMLFGYGIFLFFDILCYRILIFNKKRLPLTGWIAGYRKVIFVFSILASLSVLFMNIAATYAFIADMSNYPEKQKPFFVAFLLLLLLSVITYIINVAGYFRSLKENKTVLNEYINDIGSSL